LAKPHANATNAGPTEHDPSSATVATQRADRNSNAAAVSLQRMAAFLSSKE
jgi:hypothetical protein